MRIEFANQAATVAKIARSLADPRSPRSWCLVLPPGFVDEGALARELATALRCEAPGRPVAVVSADVLPNRAGYARELQRQWGMGSDEAEVNDPHSDGLVELLSSLTAERPAFQVLVRFHKIVKTLDQFVLGELREAEQSGRLRTVTLTPLGYGELKNRWRVENIPFCVSDYGDKHHRENVLPAPRDKMEAALREVGAPGWMGEFTARFTGGYPGIMVAVLTRWEAEGRPVDQKPATLGRLRDAATESLGRFVESLDGPGENRFLTAVCDLAQGLDTANASYRLRQHDWRGVLLEDASRPGGPRLRAEAVGRAAVARLAANAAASPGHWPDLWQRGRELYRQRHYQDVGRLLNDFSTENLRPHLYLLRQQALVMSQLAGGQPEEVGFDPDWKAVTKTLRETLGYVTRHGGDLPDGADFLSPALRDLEEIAEEVCRAVTLGERFVDTLSGLGKTPANATLAALVMALRYEACRQAADGAAVQLAIALPEQIFRSWAYAGAGVNYYQAPAASESVWEQAAAHWATYEKRGGVASVLTPTAPGQQFTNFRAFAYFLYAWLDAPGMETIPARPEPDLPALQSSLSLFETRNGVVHALTANPAAMRPKFFKLIERWLDCFCSCCPGATTRAALLAHVAPLPLLGEDGRIAE